MESTTCDPRPYLRHQALAIAWVRYNSATGNALARLVIRTMNRLSVETLERMLSARGIEVK